MRAVALALGLPASFCLCLLLQWRAPAVTAATVPSPPNTLPVPADYREWIYLSSGLDMAYAEPGAAPLPEDHVSVFDNVFVNPEAYRAFRKTAAWPSGTVFVLENRAGERNSSINKAGRTQGLAVTGIELHAKFGDTWAFYARNGQGAEQLIARPASCYTCHEEHAAVDTTFTQFYPTLLPLAREKHVLSPNYLRDSAGVAAR